MCPPAAVFRRTVVGTDMGIFMDLHSRNKDERGFSPKPCGARRCAAMPCAN
jgi:hypothetical protein